MPKYDYRCSGCGNVYEKREGFDAPSLQACPSCGAEARRVLTPPAIVFKGSGWYATDSRKGSASDSASAPAAASSDTASTPGDSAKSESAPAKSESSASTAAAAD